VIVAVPVWLVLLKVKVVMPPDKVFVAVVPAEPLAPAIDPIVVGEIEALMLVPFASTVPSCRVTVTVNVVNELVGIDVAAKLSPMLSVGVGVNTLWLPPPPPPQLARPIVASSNTKNLLRAFMSDLQARNCMCLSSARHRPPDGTVCVVI